MRLERGDHERKGCKLSRGQGVFYVCLEYVDMISHKWCKSDCSVGFGTRMLYVGEIQ